MKTFLFVLLLSLPLPAQILSGVLNAQPGAVGPATPTLVQWHSCGGTGDATVTGSGHYNCRLPNVTTAGNTITVVCASTNTGGGGTGTVTVSDDGTSGGNTYSAGVTQQGNYWQLREWHSVAISKTSRVISVTPSATYAHWQCQAQEFNNVTAIDNSGSFTAHSGYTLYGATSTGGGMTPAHANDLLVNTCVIDGVMGSSSTPTSFSSGGTQGTVTWSFGTTTLGWGMASQYGQQATAAVIRPSMTVAGTGTNPYYACVTQAYQTGTSGGTLAGMHIVGELDEDNQNYGTATFALQMPVSGNLMVLGWGAITDTITSMSSTGDSWTCPAGANITANNETAQFCYGQKSTPGNSMANAAKAITLVTTGGGAGPNNIKVYDVAGASASTYDKAAEDSGTLSAHTDLTAPAAGLTPAAAGIVFGAITNAGNTVTGTTGVALLDSCTFDGEFGVDTTCGRNNGIGHYYNPNTTAVSFTWHYGDTGNVDGWAAAEIAFK